MNCCVIGNLTLDIVASSVPEMPRWGTESFVDSVLFRTAGNLGNVALALAAMDMAPDLIGNVGADREGALLLEELGAAGLDVRRIRVEKGARTSLTIAVVKDDGERLFLTLPGQLSLMSKAFVDASIDSLAGGYPVLLCSLFQMPNLHLSEMAEIAAALKRKGCAVLVDPGWDPGGWQAHTVEGVRRLLAQVDYFLPNLEEARKVSGSDNEERVLAYLVGQGAANVIIKKGATGCIASLDGHLVSSQAFATTAADTTGAGDVFNAALLYCLAHGIGSGRMLDAANAAAALSIARPTNRYPKIVEIEEQVKRGRRREGKDG